MSFVDFNGVWLAYDEELLAAGQYAVEDITLQVGEGEFIAIVGPSGCGKSTFMKLATGLRRPSRGTVTIAGAPVTGPVKITGMAFQAPSLLPWRTTLANVMLPLEIVEPYRSSFKQRKAEYEAKAVALLGSVGLAGYEHQYPWQLSGGMQQRASICRALVHEPKMLLRTSPSVRSMPSPARSCGARCATCRRRSASTSSWSRTTCARACSWPTPST